MRISNDDLQIIIRGKGPSGADENFILISQSYTFHQRNSHKLFLLNNAYSRNDKRSMSGPSSLSELYVGPRTRSRSRSASRTSQIGLSSDSDVSLHFKPGKSNEFAAISRIKKKLI